MYILILASVILLICVAFQQCASTDGQGQGKVSSKRKANHTILVKKTMFSQVSVCPQRGGGYPCSLVHGLWSLVPGPFLGYPLVPGPRSLLRWYPSGLSTGVLLSSQTGPGQRYPFLLDRAPNRTMTGVSRRQDMPRT